MDYRDKFYENYVSTHTNNLYGDLSLRGLEREFPAWNARFERFLPKDKNAKILDLGCGNGGFVFWLQTVGYQNAEGIDMSVEQIATAKRLGIKNIRLDDAKEFLNSLITNSNKETTKYDVVFARDFLEHLRKEELVNFVPMIFKILRGGGTFIVQTVNAESLLGARLRYADFTHETAFTKSSISQLMRVAGFDEIKVYPMRPLVHGLFSLVRYILWRGMELCLHVVLITASGYKKGVFTQDLLCVARK